MAEAHRKIAGAKRVALTRAFARLMAYLGLRRTRTILSCFLVVSVLLVAFSGVDISIARLYFDHGFYMADQGWVRMLHHAVRGFIVASMVLVIGVHFFSRLLMRNLFEVDGRKIAYLFLVLIVGAGLIVNVALKDSFGRARPRDIVEFGGSAQFTPAFVIADACDDNCSFSSGDSAGAFFALAFIPVVRRKRTVSMMGVGFGVLVSASRIASGAHFFSDTVVSFFVMLIVADCLHYCMFQPELEAEPIKSTPALESGIRIGATGKSFP